MFDYTFKHLFDYTGSQRFGQRNEHKTSLQRPEAAKADSWVCIRKPADMQHPTESHKSCHQPGSKAPDAPRPIRAVMQDILHAPYCHGGHWASTNNCLQVWKQRAEVDISQQTEIPKGFSLGFPSDPAQAFSQISKFSRRWRRPKAAPSAGASIMTCTP